MKPIKFIIQSILMLLGAVFLVILVYIFVQTTFNKSNIETSEKSAVLDGTDVTSATELVTPTVTTEGVYLRDLPLTDSQKSLADTFGIDVETYYITPETVTCAEEKLGAERYAEIENGNSPTFFEASRLLGCL